MRPTKALLLLLAAATPLALAAGAVGPLKSFVNNTVADANDVNANFTALKTAVDDNAVRLTAVEQRFVAATPLPSAASAPTGTFAAGSTYFDTTLKVLRVWNGTSWESAGVGPGSPGYPATSASQIKAAYGTPANGAYHYSINGSTKLLYTDFTTYPAFPMVLVTRLSSADNQQYLTTERNLLDLVSANTTAPARSAKLSDADLNVIIATNTIRWTIVASKAGFYRMNDAWTSNFGLVANCSYATTYYNAFATPSNTPVWQTPTQYSGGCGGAQDASLNWMPLTGIHVNDTNYNGGYTGASTSRGNAPAAYVTATVADNTWNQPGYVFLSW